MTYGSETTTEKPGPAGLPAASPVTIATAFTKFIFEVPDITKPVMKQGYCVNLDHTLSLPWDFSKISRQQDASQFPALLGLSACPNIRSVVTNFAAKLPQDAPDANIDSLQGALYLGKGGDPQTTFKCTGDDPHRCTEYIGRPFKIRASGDSFVFKFSEGFKCHSSCELMQISKKAQILSSLRSPVDIPEDDTGEDDDAKDATPVNQYMISADACSAKIIVTLAEMLRNVKLASLKNYEYDYGQFAQTKLLTTHPCAQPKAPKEHIPELWGYVYARCKDNIGSVIANELNNIGQRTVNPTYFGNLMELYSEFELRKSVHKNIDHYAASHTAASPTATDHHPAPGTPVPGINYDENLRDASQSTPNMKLLPPAPPSTPQSDPFAYYPHIEGIDPIKPDAEVTYYDSEVDGFVVGQSTINAVENNRTPPSSPSKNTKK